MVTASFINRLSQAVDRIESRSQPRPWKVVTVPRGAVGHARGSWLYEAAGRSYGPAPVHRHRREKILSGAVTGATGYLIIDVTRAGNVDNRKSRHYLSRL